ncbi:MAG TPA: hypothetical protein PKH40_11605 [Treponemataceae bacterium]|jgi:hypothetical protein|nr:hypothetical protein [Treponemataceae bacterium]HPX47089.1 hypothetical protein [Treponemataceae bacterium]HQL33727.1 hypothetical protein [Treponemataceae bacterium]
MLQKIVFQDNIYQLARSIDILYEGLQLELSGDYFFNKTVDDILFFDDSIQKLYGQAVQNPHMSGYITILQSIHNCQKRYLLLLDSILQGRSCMKEAFKPLLAKLQNLRNTHTALSSEIVQNIRSSDKSMDSRDIVSRNELSELLHF